MRIVLGTAELGLPYGVGSHEMMTDAGAGELLSSAFRLGVFTFDTAPAYGVAEERLGRHLTGTCEVWTKVTLGTDVRQSLSQSLKRLQRQNVSVLWHNFSAAMLDDPQFQADVELLRRDPRVDSLGATTYGTPDALVAVTCGLFDHVNVEWNLLDQRVVNAIQDTAIEHQVELSVRSVLLRGILAGERAKTPELRAAVVRATAEAALRNLTLTELALGAALNIGGVSSVVVGCRTPDELAQVVRLSREPADRFAGVEHLCVGASGCTDPRNL